MVSPRRFLLLAALFALPLVGAQNAYAAGDPGCQKTCGGAAFSPAFSDSPVTLVICMVPDSCRIGPK